MWIVFWVAFALLIAGLWFGPQLRRPVRYWGRPPDVRGQPSDASIRSGDLAQGAGDISRGGGWDSLS